MNEVFVLVLLILLDKHSTVSDVVKMSCIHHKKRVHSETLAAQFKASDEEKRFHLVLATY